MERIEKEMILYYLENYFCDVLVYNYLLLESMKGDCGEKEKG